MVGGESQEETLLRRLRQSQGELLGQLTISVKDYTGTGGGSFKDSDELRADVRGLMKHHGLVIIRDALSGQEVSDVSDLADANQKCICEALDARKIPYNSHVNDSETICFEEVAVRCRGRMDVRFSGEDCKNNIQYTKRKCTSNNGPKQRLPSLPLIENLASSVLHGAEEPNLIYAGWIFSFPGSADQPWHQDGSPLFERGTGSLPSYALNVFCGLHQENLLELGPTEFVVGSHCMEPDVAMSKVSSAVSVVLGRGDILLYDYRICHRVR
jgi:ectoine hydroxylase-related dioxygenase (phytanoyl-CoA dioxygenase family)